MVKGVAEQVIFHQPVEHAMLPEFYAACDAGVFPVSAMKHLGSPLQKQWHVENR